MIENNNEVSKDLEKALQVLAQAKQRVAKEKKKQNEKKRFDEPVTCIKINYLDGVLEAVEGCEGLIRKYLPKLVMDVGFEIYNVLKLYEYIKGLNLNYRFYLRFNRAMTSPFTLYAAAF